VNGTGLSVFFFVCFLSICLFLGDLFKPEFAPWQPHRVSQL
jgi:hypothetical protein